MEKLNRAAKCSILGPQNLGSRGGPGPPGPPPGSAAVEDDISVIFTSKPLVDVKPFLLVKVQ